MKMVFVSGGNGKEDAQSQGGCGGNGKPTTIIYYDATYKTNADRIRAMSDEELADELLTVFAAFYEVEWSKDAVLDWLKKEAKE
jgi:hypothetical protein